MAEFTAFDVFGPIMVGPSSSHTAGACKIAKTALKICGSNFKSVKFYLHGSFAHTYKGHGTDRALLGGILGFDADNPNIQYSFELADKNNVKYSFDTTDLGEKYHPNTVKIVFSYEDKEDYYIIGSSIGGGAIIIVDINGMEVEFRGLFPTLLFKYHEQKGIIADVSSVLYENNYNIESMNTNKNPLTEIVTLTVELNRNLADDLVFLLLNSKKFLEAKYVGV